jgi:hypothetical protein
MKVKASRWAETRQALEPGPRLVLRSASALISSSSGPTGMLGPALPRLTARPHLTGSAGNGVRDRPAA